MSVTVINARLKKLIVLAKLIASPHYFLSMRCVTARSCCLFPGNYRVGLIHFLAGWHKRLPKQG